MKPTHKSPQTIYEIQVQGHLDQSWASCFNSLSVAHSNTGGQTPTTTLTGPIADQAALRGLLCKLWDLNLTLISLRRIPVPENKEQSNG